ncbi:MAG: hypothetical protein GY812_11590 [Actinomycetia bacterium]|nr:hypothetical protein [Actinomycetes bacterium]
MDIEHFYDGNPKRRSSREYSFGQDWTDSGGTRWELNWVEDTGEVYVMREAGEPLVMDPLGDTAVPEISADQVTVEILGTIQGLEAVETAFSGWSDAQSPKGSLDWVRSRVADVVAGVSHAGEGSDPEPDSLPGSG